MSPLRLPFFIAIILVIGCDLSPKISVEQQQNYPGLIKDSSERRERAEREWRRMLDFYNVPQTPPDLYPIIYTPRSLLGISGGIRIMAAKPEPGTQEIALREAVKNFFDRWRELIGAEPTALSLVSAKPSGDSWQLIYQQANYPFPIAGGFGEIVVVISADGRLLQLDDRLIPVVELPARPEIDKERAAAKIAGRTFTYTDASGREQRIQIAARSQVSTKRAVVVAIEKGDSLEVHLAWEIIAGRSLTWTLYLDAMTGAELRVEQNFQALDLGNASGRKGPVFEV
jgi:hypothetical protein